MGFEMSKSCLMRSALSAAFIAAIGFSTPAQALEAKQCLSMTDMNAALKEEGQRTMIIGDRVFIESSTGNIMDAKLPKFLNTVTSNDGGSVGYQLEGDKPRAQTSDKVCVRAKLTNVRFFDARRPGLNRSALLGGDFNQSIINSEPNGTRPMVVADSVHRDSSGVERTGLPVVVLGNMEVRAGVVITRQPDGSTLKMFSLTNTEYTPAGLDRIGQRQVAMLSPK
jgi:hypothetical protein